MVMQVIDYRHAMIIRDIEATVWVVSVVVDAVRHDIQIA